MSRPVYALVAICILSGVAAYLLSLSPAQRFEAAISALTPERALDRLTLAEAAGQLDENLELKLGELALAAGDAQKARDAFARLGAVPALSAVAEARLSEVFLMEGDLREAAAHLEIAYRAAPDAEARLRLGGWYRSLGDRKSEQRVLASVAATALTEPEALRLVDLERAAGQTEAIETLLRTLTESHGQEGRRWRLRLIDFLLDADRPGDAWRAARGWWKSDHDPASLSAFIGTLLDRGAVAEATALAEEALTERPHVANAAITLFVSRGYGARAIALQARWLDALDEPDAQAWNTVVAVAAGSGHVDGVWSLLSRTTPSQADPAFVAAALEQVLRYRGARALARALDWLTPAVVTEAPLLSAALAADTGRDRDLYDALLRTAERPMTGWETALWMSFATRLRGTPGWIMLFREVPPDSPAAAALSGAVIAATSSGATE